MKAGERIKLQRKIRNTNKVMIKILETENGLEDFKKWFSNKDNPLRVTLLLLGMAEDEFIAEALKTNINYPFYEAVNPITTFMMLKANVYEAYLDTLEKTPFAWHFKD